MKLRVSLMIDRDVLDDLRVLAKAEDRSLSSMVNITCRRTVDQHRNKIAQARAARRLADEAGGAL